MLVCNGLGVARRGRRILEDVSFTLEPHSFTALLGKNGSGKSTLVSCIAQQSLYEGSLLYSGTELRTLAPRERARHIAVLPQVLPVPSVTVRELAGFGRSPYLSLNRRFTPEDTRAVAQALTRTGLLPLADRSVQTLSGGERQRAFLAMVIAQETEVLVLDEPTTYLDVQAEDAFLQLLRALTQSGKTLLVVLHQLSLAAQYADRLLVLDRHTAAFCGTRQEALEQQVLERVFRVRRGTVDTQDGTRTVFFA